MLKSCLDMPPGFEVALTELGFSPDGLQKSLSHSVILFAVTILFSERLVSYRHDWCLWMDMGDTAISSFSLDWEVSKALCGFQIPCWSKHMLFHSERTFLWVLKWFILLVNFFNHWNDFIGLEYISFTKKKKYLQFLTAIFIYLYSPLRLLLLASMLFSDFHYSGFGGRERRTAVLYRKVYTVLSYVYLIWNIMYSKTSFEYSESFS